MNIFNLFILITLFFSFENLSAFIVIYAILISAKIKNKFNNIFIIIFITYIYKQFLLGVKLNLQNKNKYGEKAIKLISQLIIYEDKNPLSLSINTVKLLYLSEKI